MISNYDLGLPIVLEHPDHWNSVCIEIENQLFNDEELFESYFKKINSFDQDRAPALTQNLCALMEIYGAVRGGAIPGMTFIFFQIGAEARNALKPRMVLVNLLNAKIKLLANIYIKS